MRLFLRFRVHLPAYHVYAFPMLRFWQRTWFGISPPEMLHMTSKMGYIISNHKQNAIVPDLHSHSNGEGQSFGGPFDMQTQPPTAK